MAVYNCKSVGISIVITCISSKSELEWFNSGLFLIDTVCNCCMKNGLYTSRIPKTVLISGHV